MQQDHSGTTRPRLDTRCWQTPDMSEIVMFHGHHDYEFIAHSHDVITLILVTQGAVEIEVDGANYLVRPGNLVMIGANQIHAARPASTQGWEMRSLHLPPSILRGLPHLWLGGSSRVVFSNPVHSNPGPASALFLEWHRRSECGDFEQRHRVAWQSFLQWLYQHIEHFRPCLDASSCTDDALLRAKQLIMATVFENTEIEEIAEEVGLPGYSLIRRFKRAFGISPHAWRMQARANAAARLLLGQESLVEVAAACGFSDQAHMTRLFRRVFGVTPSQYGSMHAAKRGGWPAYFPGKRALVGRRKYRH